MNAKEKVKEIKQQLAKLRPFRLGCYCCHVKWHKKGMTFHHKWYVAGEKTYRDFGSNALAYYEYLKDIVIERPKGFLFLCNPDHQIVERLKRLKPERFERIVKAVRMSR